MNNSHPVSETTKGVSPQDLLNYLAVCIMMVCFSVVLVNTINSGIPTWKGGYIVFLALLVSIESLTTSRLVKNSTILNSNPLVTRISEWVVILIVVKIVKYLVSNPAQFLADLPRWRENFGTFFLSDDYLLVCVFLFFIWLLSFGFANCFSDLEEDKELFDLERQGFAQTNRPGARKNIMALIFGMGLAMLFFTTISNVNLRIVTLHSDAVRTNIALILLFFLMGFIILSQGQLSILRARWFIEDVPVNPLIRSRWVSYSILVVFIISLIALLLSFLPGSYALGLFDVIRSALNILFGIFTFFILIFAAIFNAVLSFLMSLFGKTTVPSAPSPQIPTPMPSIPPPPVANASWVEILKSILFWAIFLIIIIFAFRHFFSQRQGMWKSVHNFPLWTWLKMTFHWIAATFRRANHAVLSILDAGVSRVQALMKTKPIHIDPLLTISTHLPPRQRILLLYFSMIRWNNQNGFPRKGNQTPLEYARSLDANIPESKGDLDSITHAFIEARYTRHQLSLGDANQVQNALEHLQAIFREHLQQEKQAQGDP
jgi:hypothetical protein